MGIKGSVKYEQETESCKTLRTRNKSYCSEREDNIRQENTSSI